jgi:hypothetical protein
MRKFTQLLLAICVTVFVFSSCGKKLETSNNKSTVQNTTNQDPMVATPGGLMPKSHVYLVERGYHLSVKDGHVLKINTKTGEVAEDFGDHLPNSGNATPSHLIPGLVSIGQGSWVTWLQWDNGSSSPINYFSTTWIVPNAPAVNNDQLIYIFNGLTDPNGVDIMQPVLQWGGGPAGGGYIWTIANWYVWSSGSAHSDLDTVNPGASLQGLIQMTGQNSDGSYNYTSSFSGHDNVFSISEGDVTSGGTIPIVPQQTAAFETLEAYHTVNGTIEYGIGEASEYPANTDKVIMNDIAISLTSGYPYELVLVGTTFEKFYDVSWTPGKLTANVGESALVMNSGDEGQGQGYLYFQPAPTINGKINVELGSTNPNVPCVISAYPGSTVTVSVNVFSIRGETGIETFTITTPGTTFSGSGTSISATNGQVVATFIMPSSGSINASATFAGAGTGSIIVY